jgi:hypothetical protein
MQERIDRRVLHEEHIAPCGVDFSALKKVKKIVYSHRLGIEM